MNDVPAARPTTAAALPRTYADITGWFSWTDQQLFRTLLTVAAPPVPGHVVELGVYLGKSAAFIADFVARGERFVVCDLFGGATDDANAKENTRSYRNLTRARFEENFRAVHGWLPEIVQAPSAQIVDHLPEHSVRLMHVDASHLYEHVRLDVDAAVRLLAPGGVVVFDDYRGQHTPGVSAAVWGAVERGELRPLLVTPRKLYAMTEDVTAVQQVVLGWLGEFGRLRWETQEVAGERLVRIWPVPRPTATPDPEDLVRQLQSRLQEGFAQLDRRASELDRRVQTVERRTSGLEQLNQGVHELLSRTSLPEPGRTRGLRPWHRHESA